MPQRQNDTTQVSKIHRTAPAPCQLAAAISTVARSRSRRTGT